VVERDLRPERTVRVANVIGLDELAGFVDEPNERRARGGFVQPHFSPPCCGARERAALISTKSYSAVRAEFLTHASGQTGVTMLLITTSNG
jgi:hypothetical protein